MLATVDWDPKFLNPKDPTSMVQRPIFAGDWRRGSLTPPTTEVSKPFKKQSLGSVMGIT